MRVYEQINALPPAGIGMMSAAHIIGGGIGGLSAAVSLINDAHMPVSGITAYELLGVVGGACDGAGDHVNGYTARGDRELVPSMECLWYVLKKVPQTCSLRPSNAEAMERLRIASLSYRLASPTKGESRAPHAQYYARAQVAMFSATRNRPGAARAIQVVNRQRRRS